jgi:hypothetical protein
MSNPDQNEQYDHWAALAEQLGLPRELKQEPQPDAAPQAAEPPVEIPAAPVPSVPEAEHEPEPEPVAERPFADEPSLGQSRHNALLTADEETLEQAAAPAEEAQEPPAPEEAAGVEDKSPPSGRRRGRRSGRGRTTKSTAGEAGEEAAGDDADKAESGRRRGRGRSRTRTKQAKAQKPAGEDDEARVVEGSEESEGRDEELDNLSDWNVPSWTELIASLYRPER